VKSLVLKISEKKGGDRDFKTLDLPPFVQFKNQAKFEVEFKSKVVDLGHISTVLLSVFLFV